MATPSNAGLPFPGLCFGGTHRVRLFITASQSVYAIDVAVQGMAYV
ncbi:MAG: hypothetical protein WCG13_02810 [Burkholderiales bacterium]